MKYKFTYEYKDRVFTDEEKRLMRPIAETLAMMDGNAFFTLELNDGREFWEQYLPEAAELFFGNGGLDGWSSEASWVKEHLLRKSDTALNNAWEQYQVVKALVEKEDEKLYMF